MRDSKLIVIISLLFLLLVSLGGIYYFYQENITIQNKQNEMVSVLVANKDIVPNTKIKKEDLKVLSIQKSSVPFDVLMQNEIVDKYATVPIFKDEPIRSEKISKLVKKKDTNSTAKIAKHDLYNIATKLFKNTNYTLQTGDKIDIVGVWGDLEKGEKLTVKYIANNAEVFGFLFRGVLEEDAMKKVEKKSIDKKTKKEVVTKTYQYADELLIDTDAPIITAIIEAHNRGHQLWMVKSGKEDKNKVLENIRMSLVQPVEVVEAPVVKKKKYKRSYPTASIEYGMGGSKVIPWK